MNNTLKEFYLFYEVFVQFVFLSSIIRGKWLRTTQYLNLIFILIYIKKLKFSKGEVECLHSV